MAQQNFDFQSFNNLTDRIPAGLSIFLAQSLLDSAAWQMKRYDNPRLSDVESLIDEIKQLRAEIKKEAALRENRG